MSRKVINLSDQEVQEKVEEFQEWIRTQSHLPQTLDKVLLARYLKIYSFRLDRAKRLLEDGLVFRKKNPWFFTNRDSTSPEIRTVVETIDMVPLLQHTKENYKVCIYQILDNDANKIVFNDCIKTFFMGCDVRFMIPVKSYSEIESGEIIIFDMKNLTFKHLTKIVISTLRLFFKYLQDAHPVRIVQLHIINCTPVINRAMVLIKPFIYAKLYNALKFHNVGSLDNLYEYVPRDILPVEYGGEAQSMTELKKYWVSVLHNNHDFLMNDEYFALNDNANPPAPRAKSALKYGGIFSFLTT